MITFVHFWYCWSVSFCCQSCLQVYQFHGLFSKNQLFVSFIFLYCFPAWVYWFLPPYFLFACIYFSISGVRTRLLTWGLSLFLMYAFNTQNFPSNVTPAAWRDVMLSLSRPSVSCTHLILREILFLFISQDPISRVLTLSVPSPIKPDNLERASLNSFSLWTF
jgi:hypothetical protein